MARTLPRYLALSKCACVASSWIVPTDLVNSGQWDENYELAKSCRTVILS